MTAEFFALLLCLISGNATGSLVPPSSVERNPLATTERQFAQSDQREDLSCVELKLQVDNLSRRTCAFRLLHPRRFQGRRRPFPPAVGRDRGMD